MSLKPYFQLMRLPNAFTAMADPLAGTLVMAGTAFQNVHLVELVVLLVVSACLYTAGIVFNDLFDFERDRVERPERPLPSGKISRKEAARLGVILLGVGLLLAAWLTFNPLLTQKAHVMELIRTRPILLIAVVLAGLILSYDYALKRVPVARELAMGLCRALNLTMGLMFGLDVRKPTVNMWWLPMILFAYVATLTAVSRMEAFPAVRRSVKWLVLGIIVLDSIFVAAFHPQDLWLALWVLALLVPAVVLGKVFEMA